MKRIIFTLTNDLNFDQRMNKICTSLASNGFDVTLVGFQKKSSVPLSQKTFKQKRLPLFFERGFFYFAETNIRLFFFLLFRPCDIICADDLDTALPVLFSSRIKNKTRVFDAHELFCEMHDIVTRPRIQKFWRTIEKFAQPKFPIGYAANNDYANEYKKMYGVHYSVIMNCPLLTNEIINKNRNEKLIIYQGAVERGRGFEQLFKAVKKLGLQLVVCGKGTYFNEIKQLAKEDGVSENVVFAGFVLPEKLNQYNQNAYIGMNVNDGFGKSFYYSLTNRFFDFMHAGIPQIANDNPENRSINEKYEIAVLVDELTAESITNAIHLLINDKELYSRLQQNCLKAREMYSWQNEEKKLIEFYRSL